MVDDIQRRATPPMGRGEFLKCINRVNRSTQHEIKALHKPLLLLLTLGRLHGKKDRLAPYQELEKPMKDLLTRFSPHKADPRYPFWHLRNDRLSNGRLWEVWVDGKLVEPGQENGSRSHPPGVAYFENPRLKGGFSEQIYQFLLESPELIEETIKKLLYENFHVSKHNEIRKSAKLPLDQEGWRAADHPFSFKMCKEILHAYECRCAVCDFDISLDDSPVGLEAVHIKWHVAGGPSKIENGLALCATHQKAFTRGAFGLVSEAEKYKIVVSEHIKGGSNSARELRGMRNEFLRLPQDGSLVPDPRYVDWHHKLVFRDNAAV